MENSAEKTSFHSDNRASMTNPLYPSLLFMTADLFASIIALRGGAILVREINGRSVHRRPAAALLVLLTRAARPLSQSAPGRISGSSSFPESTPKPVLIPAV